MRTLACVINWNTAGELPGVISSLQGLVGLHALVVIDNGSKDGSADVVRAQPDVRLIANVDNLGYAGAANQAVAVALQMDADALLLCNPDVRLSPDYLVHATAALDADPARASVAGKLWRRTDTSAAGPRIIDTTGHLAFRTRLFRNRGEGMVDHGQFDTPGEIFGVSGAAALYRVSALREVAVRGEVFDQDLFAFFEDVDLDWRLRRMGWSSWYEPRATGWHERGGAGTRRSAFVEELNFANRLLLLAKNDHPRLLLRDLPGVAVTTLLKTVELGITQPSAFRAAWPRLWARWARVRAKRPLIEAMAVVRNEEIVRRWFGPFDYREWVRERWRRGRAERQAKRLSRGDTS